MSTARRQIELCAERNALAYRYIYKGNDADGKKGIVFGWFLETSEGYTIYLGTSVKAAIATIEQMTDF